MRVMLELLVSLQEEEEQENTTCTELELPLRVLVPTELGLPSYRPEVPQCIVDRRTSHLVLLHPLDLPSFDLESTCELLQESKLPTLPLDLLLVKRTLGQVRALRTRRI